MLTVLETPEFIASAETIWSAAERMAFVDWISENPYSGDVIPGSGGLCKVRWSRAGRGKRAGVRVIYFLRLEGVVVVLLYVYAKAAFDNLRPEFLRKLREKIDETQ